MGNEKSVVKKRKAAHAGLSITRESIELVVINPKTGTLQECASVQTPYGMLDDDGDRVLDANLLKEALRQLYAQSRSKPKLVNLSVPGTLLRMVEIHRLETNELYMSLSSEAERYKSFDDTEAVVDFYPIEGPTSMPNKQRVIFGAVRNDTLAAYMRALQGLKLKVAAVELEPLNILRGMAVTGVLDSLIAQIGEKGYWGTIFVESNRLRLSIWCGNEIVDLRETHMNTADFHHATHDSIVVEDVMEEIRRSTKNVQPVIWLTHQMPDVMAQVLSERLNVPVRPCMMAADMIGAPQELMISSVGAAFSSVVAYPLPFNLLEGATRVPGSGGNAGAVAAAASVSEGNDALAGTLMTAGIVGSVLAAVVAGGLYAYDAFMIKGELAQVETQNTALLTEVSALQADVATWRRRTNIDGTVMDLIKDAAKRNQVYVQLAEDLKNKTPGDLWVYNVKVEDKIEVQGKAMHHKNILSFAKSFDDAKYMTSVLIDSIAEEMLHGQRVFTYKIGGNIALNAPVAVPAATAGAATPAGGN